MKNALPIKLQNSLRVGDTVRIHLDHYPETELKGQPFEPFERIA